MSTPTRFGLSALALAGAVFASAALAEMGPGGPEIRGTMMLDRFETMDADKDGKVSLAEIEAHRKTEFAEADTNGDGALSAEELSAHQLAKFTETVAERTARMIEYMDNDGNGSLSEDEIGEGPGMRHFARIDADNDGAISKAEAEEAIKHVRKWGHGWGMGDN